MEAPVCLIENNPNEKLQVNLEALEILQNIQQPVVVVAIVGLYRTGKSYLMNKLAGKDQGGFSLGATIQANTMGIWMWCLPHPIMPDHTLVLLDTEGLGDVEKSNTQNDAWIFALSILLSSTFVYNSVGTINQYALEKLQYVTELTKHIKVKASPKKTSEEDESDFLRFFPVFIWAVRDFSLQLKLNGRRITEDEYLENALKRKPESPETLDLAKKCIRQYFPSRKCFVFDRPAGTRDLEDLEDLPESKLCPDFLEQADKFCKYIHNNAQPKMIQGGHRVTGKSLGHLVQTYVDAIASGTVPCIENAVTVLAQIENTAAVQDAIMCYEAAIKQRVQLPTETVNEVLEAHGHCEKEALKLFMARAFKDDNHEYQKNLANQMKSKLQELISHNEQVSLDRCQALLMALFRFVEERISNGSYSVPGGYQMFLEEQKEKLQHYERAPKKGLMAAKALQDFLKSREMTVQSILKADQILTDKQKEIEVEKIQAEASKREAELHEKMRIEAEERAEQEKQSYEEHKNQLLEKMEADRRRLLAENEAVLSRKLEEQRRVQEEGFHREYSRLQGEIQNLRSQISEQASSPCVIL
nr:guanylate-binding protein 1-like [Pogona vitticeps]